MGRDNVSDLIKYHEKKVLIILLTSSFFYRTKNDFFSFLRIFFSQDKNITLSWREAECKNIYDA